MKVCPRCSTELRDQARFCSHCGAPQAVGDSKLPTGAAQAEPTLPSAYASPSKSNRWKSPGLWLAGIVVLVLLVSLVSWLNSRQTFPVSTAPVSTQDSRTSSSAQTSPSSALTPSPTTGSAAIFTAGQTNLTVAPPSSAEIPTSLATTQSLAWYGEGESFSVLMRDGQVIDGEALGKYRWEAASGQFDGRFLVVTFTTTQTSGCAAKITYTFEVKADGFYLIQVTDGCGNVDTIGGKTYLQRSKP